MEPFAGINVNASYHLADYWKDACSIWVTTIERLCSNFSYCDAPWEYLERTNSAILAGSLTAVGAPAMPETYVMRNRDEQRHERVDICVVTADSGLTTHELIECKLAEYDAHKQRTVGRVKSRLRHASEQLFNITGIHGIKTNGLSLKRTGVVIGLPCFSSDRLSSSPFDMGNAVQLIIKDLKSLSTVDMTAWCFPKQYIGVESRRYKKKFYPGTFLAVQKVT